MARSSNPDSATSEFAIQLKDNSAYLEYHYKELDIFSTGDLNLVIVRPGKWLGPGGADSYGYGVFATVIDGWNVVMKIMDLPRTSNPGSATMLSTPVLINKAYIKRTDRYNVNV
jgi:cyclophilin family peptidyl-prolyl cis-trans isomerase